jgi:hypothetical protein
MTDSKYIDGFHDEPTAGLFAHVNTEVSVERMCSALADLGQKPTNQVKNWFARISDSYWEKKSFADREKAAPSTKELRKIASKAQSLADAVDSAKPVVQGKLTKALQRAELHVPRPELLVALVDDLRRLSKIETPAGRGRGRPQPRHIDYAVKAVARTWPLVFGSKFALSFKTAPGRNGDEFVSPSAPFVLKLCHALDSDMQHEEIITALKKLRRKDLS